MTRNAMLVIYDVAADGRRNRVRDALRPMGWWHQRSVWIVPPSPDHKPERLAQGLGSLLTAKDRLIVVEPCTACRRETMWTPASAPPWPSGPVTV